jgi:hypothetical protein
MALSFKKIIPKEVYNPVSLINPGLGLTYGLSESGKQQKQTSPGSYSGMMPLAPAAPKLQPYEGYTNKYGVAVSLTPGEKAAEQLATNLISGTEGTFKQSLSGKPNYGEIDRLISIQDRDFENQVLPDLKKIAQTGPYKNSGLAKRVEADARLSMSDQAAELRYQEYQAAKQEALAAAQILPSLTGVAGLTRNNEINNILRDMEVHFQNQGLTVQQYGMQAQQFANNLALAQFEYQQWANAENLRMQQEAAAAAKRSSGLGMLGGLVGAGIGLATGAGPAGAAMGYQLGSGVGYAAGGDRMSGQSQLGSAMGTYANYSLYNQQRADMLKLLAPKEK